MVRNAEDFQPGSSAPFILDRSATPDTALEEIKIYGVSQSRRCLIEASGFSALTVLTVACTVVVIALFWWSASRAQNDSTRQLAELGSS